MIFDSSYNSSIIVITFINLKICRVAVIVTVIGSLIHHKNKNVAIYIRMWSVSSASGSGSGIGSVPRPRGREIPQ